MFFKRKPYNEELKAEAAKLHAKIMGKLQSPLEVIDETLSLCVMDKSGKIIKATSPFVDFLKSTKARIEGKFFSDICTNIADLNTFAFGPLNFKTGDERIRQSMCRSSKINGFTVIEAK